MKAVKKILVVEDDPAIQRALKRLFEAEDFAVEITSDGRSALEAFHATAPSAVVLDLRLPQVAGSDVCRETKTKAPALPVIVLSAKTGLSDKVLLLERGALKTPYYGASDRNGVVVIPKRAGRNLRRGSLA